MSKHPSVPRVVPRFALAGLALAGSWACAGSAAAETLVEGFEATFPARESGYLGVHTNLTNVYGPGAGRGNNPDGLWVSDGDAVWSGDADVNIAFDSPFASTLTSFQIDVATYISGMQIRVYDASGVTLLSSVVVPTFGGHTEPGVYAHFGVTSSTGIGGFSFTHAFGGIEGNTSIDNVVVTTGAAPAPVPLPAAAWGGMALMGLVGAKRFRRREPRA